MEEPIWGIVRDGEFVDVDEISNEAQLAEEEYEEDDDYSQESEDDDKRKGVD